MTEDWIRNIAFGGKSRNLEKRKLWWEGRL